MHRILLSPLQYIGIESMHRISLNPLQYIGIGSMHGNFTFSHQVMAEQSDSFDDMEDLFRIGHQRIIESEPPDHLRMQEKHRSKDKKVKKKHRKKRQKQTEKKDPCCNDNEHLGKHMNPIALEPNDTHPRQSLSRDLLLYQERTPEKELEEILGQEFALKQQIGSGNRKLLRFDIIKFGTEPLGLYGPAEADVPRYRRPPGYYQVVGMRNRKRKDCRKMRKIIESLNLKINQKNQERLHTREEQLSYDRYFNFQGYQNVDGFSPQKYEFATDDMLLFDPEYRQATKLLSPAHQVRAINQELNSQLAGAPEDVELWLRFLSIQKKYTEFTVCNTPNAQDQSENIYSCILERKLSIVQKALEHIKKSEASKLHRYHLLLLEQQMKRDRSETQKILHEYIRSEGRAIRSVDEDNNLWHFYFQKRVANFSKYTHTYLTNEHDSLTASQADLSIKCYIDTAISSQDVRKLTRISLNLLHSLLRIIKMEGYYELCTGTLVALLEYNLFNPQQQGLQDFGNYWENLGVFKLGEHPEASWLNRVPISTSQPNQYIGDLFVRNNRETEEQPQHKSVKYFGFLPANSVHHSLHIEQHPHSFVMFEDIKPYLKTYPNMEDCEKIVDTLYSLLGMPPVFSHSQTYSHTLLIEWLENQKGLSPHVGLGNNVKHAFGCSWDFSPWSRYWHPLLTHQFIPLEKHPRFIYIVNITEQLVHCGITNTKAINRYLLFLYGVIYTHQPLQRYYGSLEQVRAKIGSTISRNHSDIEQWALYVEFESLNGSYGLDECLSCYIRLLESVESTNQQAQTHRRCKKLEILYWLDRYLSGRESSDRKINPNNARIQILKSIVFQEPLNQSEISASIYSQDQPLNGMDQLLIASRLNECAQELQRLKSNKSVPSADCSRYTVFVYYFLVKIGQDPTAICHNLLKMGSMFAIDVMMDLKILKVAPYFNSVHDSTQTHPASIEIHKHLGNVRLLQYWLKELGSREGPEGLCSLLPTLWLRYRGAYPEMEEDHTYLDPPKSMLLNWLLIARLLNESQLLLSNRIDISQVFLDHAKEIVRKQIKQYPSAILEPECVILLNKMMNDPEFALMCLDKMPYAGCLYRIAGLNQQYKQRMDILKLQKELIEEEASV